MLDHSIALSKVVPFLDCIFTVTLKPYGSGTDMELVIEAVVLVVVAESPEKCGKYIYGVEV